MCRHQEKKEDYQANDGVTAIYGSDDAKKPGQAYSMIKIASSKVVVKGGALQVSVWIQPASSGSFTYDAIYVGNRNDETKEPIILGEVDTEKILKNLPLPCHLKKQAEKSLLYQEMEERRGGVLQVHWHSSFLQWTIL